MGRTDPIHTALTGLVRALEETEVPYMIVGGMAVVLRGHPRFTRDIDALADMDPARIPALLKALGRGWKARVAGPVRFARERAVLPLGAPGRMTVDLLLPSHPVEREAIGRATTERVRGLPVKVVSLEDLILLKVGAHRTRDLEDVEALLALHGRKVDRKRLTARVRALSKDLGDEDAFELWSVLSTGRGRRSR